MMNFIEDHIEVVAIPSIIAFFALVFFPFF